MNFKYEEDAEIGSSDYYKFNLYLRSGKIETVYFLIPVNPAFNKEGIDDLKNIINQYINYL